MSIIEYKINGETFYTHDTWLSLRQRRAWHNIPAENNNLALYYSLSTLAVVAIGYKKLPFISNYFKQMGFYAGSGVLALGSWLGWSLVMRAKTAVELNSVIETNDCLYTPFWKTLDSVIDLRQKGRKDNYAGSRYINRSKGRYSQKEQIEKFKPDFILENSKADQILQSFK